MSPSIAIFEAALMAIIKVALNCAKRKSVRRVSLTTPPLESATGAWNIHAPVFQPRPSRGTTREMDGFPFATTLPTLPLLPSLQHLTEALQPLLLTPEQLWAMGYPVELEPTSSKAVVYIHPPPWNRPSPLNVNAPEFIPGASAQTDSGRGSWIGTPDEALSGKVCARCKELFTSYSYDEVPCLYHWGRKMGGRYSCCNETVGSQGCATHPHHVHSGTNRGMNVLEGFVKARSPRGGVYAVDAEMCYTTSGLELASIVVLAADGKLVYSSLVKTSSPVVDYNTRFSGITPEDMSRATKTLQDVQRDILGLVGSDTVLIGHALENDLRALRLVHGAVVDTSVLYPHARGFPWRQALRVLSEQHLGRLVQRGCSGHSPLEDAQAALDLVFKFIGFS